ncbi:MAG: bifunctional oligoribonuclease/PAP phosphatase NrnA [Acidobacteria bacterium]|nr:bifunctional oligoribonuclease/PAP phosphatase NrnA [Acidobacteriota bacterium]
MSSPTRDPRTALRCLADARRVLITSHRSPDGDAIGTELICAALAGRLGVDSVVWNRDPAPAGLAELPGAGSIRVANALPDDFPAAYDLVATMECPGLDRTGFEGLTRLPVLNIDHHRENEAFGVVNYLDEEAPAAGEMVWRMFTISGVQPDADAATCAFVALSTDTGDFRYSNATQRAFQAASEMVAYGARPEQVAQWIHERRSAASVRLMAQALATLELRCSGRIAVIQADPGAFRRAGAHPSDTEDIINLPRSIAGVEAVVFLKQWEPGITRVSLRSKGAVDVRSVAAAFGGGGHTNAAGCTVASDLGAARELLLARLERSLECTT